MYGAMVLCVFTPKASFCFILDSSLSLMKIFRFPYLFICVNTTPVLLSFRGTLPSSICLSLRLSCYSLNPSLFPWYSSILYLSFSASVLLLSQSFSLSVALFHPLSVFLCVSPVTLSILLSFRGILPSSICLFLRLSCYSLNPSLFPWHSSILYLSFSASLLLLSQSFSLSVALFHPLSVFLCVSPITLSILLSFRGTLPSSICLSLRLSYYSLNPSLFPWHSSILYLSFSASLLLLSQSFSLSVALFHPLSVFLCVSPITLSILLSFRGTLPSSICLSLSLSYYSLNPSLFPWHSSILYLSFSASLLLLSQSFSLSVALFHPLSVFLCVSPITLSILLSFRGTLPSSICLSLRLSCYSLNPPLFPWHSSILYLSFSASLLLLSQSFSLSVALFHPLSVFLCVSPVTLSILLSFRGTLPSSICLFLRLSCYSLNPSLFPWHSSILYLSFSASLLLLSQSSSLSPWHSSILYLSFFASLLLLSQSSSLSPWHSSILYLSFFASLLLLSQSSSLSPWHSSILYLSFFASLLLLSQSFSLLVLSHFQFDRFSILSQAVQ